MVKRYNGLFSLQQQGLYIWNVAGYGLAKAITKTSVVLHVQTPDKLVFQFDLQIMKWVSFRRQLPDNSEYINCDSLYVYCYSAIEITMNESVSVCIDEWLI